MTLSGADESKNGVLTPYPNSISYASLIPQVYLLARTEARPFSWDWIGATMISRLAPFFLP